MGRRRLEGHQARIWGASSGCLCAVKREHNWSGFEAIRNYRGTPVRAALSGLGRGQAATGNIAEAVSNMTRAFDYYVDSGAIEQALAIVGYNNTGRVIFEMAGPISRALDLVPAGSSQAGYVLSNLGFSLASTSEDNLATRMPWPSAARRAAGPGQVSQGCPEGRQGA